MDDSDAHFYHARGLSLLVYGFDLSLGSVHAAIRANFHRWGGTLEAWGLAKRRYIAVRT